jgi:hypothetical protein
MKFVAGESVEPNIDPDADERLPSPDVLEARAHSAASLLGALHRVQPYDVGLSDEPIVSAAAEVERWATALATVDPGMLGGSDDCAEVLRATVPAPMPSSIIHGDFRLGNCLSEGPGVLAVIDWEIWACSDPRIDLAWFLLTADPDQHPSAIRRAPGMPRPEELLETFLQRAGSVPELDWFTGLILYKLAAAKALIAKNAAKRGDPDGSGARGRRLAGNATSGASGDGSLASTNPPSSPGSSRRRESDTARRTEGRRCAIRQLTSARLRRLSSTRGTCSSRPARERLESERTCYGGEHAQIPTPARLLAPCHERVRAGGRSC